MAFDENLHPRGSAGTFIDKPHSVPEMTLQGDDAEAGHALSKCEHAGNSRPAVDMHVYPEDVAPNLAAFDEYVDIFVSSIDKGHLSRGVAGRKRTTVARAWMAEASAAAQQGIPEADEFFDGLRRGVVALYYEKADYQGSLFDLNGPDLDSAAHHALHVAETKRASQPEREFWRMHLKHTSAAEHRGMLVAAAALSGTDRWWGFRDHPLEVMTGIR